MELMLSKTYFAAGETIDGTVVMELGESIESKGVFVSLSSVEHRSTYVRGKPSTQSYTHYWSRVPLDVEKVYPAGQRFEYQFSLVAPSLGVPFDPVSLLRRLVAKGPTAKKFKVEAKLDISRGFDVSASKDVTISYLQSGGA